MPKTHIYRQVRARAERVDRNLARFPKPLRAVARVGSALGSIVSPREAQDNVYRVMNKIETRKATRLHKSINWSKWGK